jgi:hypothetical protein
LGCANQQHPVDNHPDKASLLQPWSLVLISKQAFVHQHRQAAESYLLHHLNNIPPTIDSVQAEAAPAACFRLLRLANLTPLASPLDLLRLACKPDLLTHINPFMGEGLKQQLLQGVLIWLQLCVLEDRLGRLVQLAAAGPEMKSMLIKVSEASCWC